MVMPFLVFSLLLASCGVGEEQPPADYDTEAGEGSDITDNDGNGPHDVRHQCVNGEKLGPACLDARDCITPGRCGFPPDGYGYDCWWSICRAVFIAPTDGDEEADIDHDQEDDLDSDPDSDGDILEEDSQSDGDDDLDPDETDAEELDWPDCVFCPKDTGLTCGEPPEPGEVATLFQQVGDNRPWRPGATNGEWLVFRYVSPDRADYAQLYGCNLLDKRLYLLLDNQHEILHLSMDGSLIVLWQGIADGSLRGNLLLGDLDTWEVVHESEVDGYETNRFPFVRYSYVAYTEDKTFPKEFAKFLHIYDMRNGQAASNPAFGVHHHRHDGKQILVTGFPESSSQAYMDGTWMAELPELNFRPLILTAADEYGTDFDGEWVVFHTLRNALPYRMWWYESMEIYLFNRRTRREIPLTDTPSRNERFAFIEYPYVGYTQNDFIVSGGVGPIEAVHLETGEQWNFANTHTEEVQVLRDRTIGMVNNGGSVQMIRFPEAGRIPDEFDCDDHNPCTDDYWWVSIPGCHYVNNHDRCDDADPNTPFNVCLDGSCTGLLLGADDTETEEIPAGGFWWGTDAVYESWREPGRVWEGPRRWLELPGFMIDKYEVTNGQYARCVEAGACAEPKRQRSGREMDYWGNAAYEDFPVLYVDWFEARNYCEWVGKRLPTEQEWTKAARGGGEPWIYPWGDESPLTTQHQYANVEIRFGEVDDAAPGGSFPEDVSPYGVYDLGGNVNEWTSSPWTPESLDAEARWGNDVVVVKGGSWRFGASWSLNDSHVDGRFPATPWSPSFFTGFRCVQGLEKQLDRTSPKKFH
ncbi:MAG: hypothetical protein C4523_12285 [Myxococcales bacterium]|nr:MAG: hypothetical protein C4523_12285 [Myxococcales bacterium]